MSASRLELSAPAKLNLFLHVIGRRNDGMHLLESVFVLIDLVDDVTLELDETGAITRTGDVVGDPNEDLCVRAALALQKQAAPHSAAASRSKNAFPPAPAWAADQATAPPY